MLRAGWPEPPPPSVIATHPEPIMSATATRPSFTIALAGLAGLTPLAAQRAPRAPARADSARQTAAAFAPDLALRALHWRLVGPFRGGRAVAVAGDPTRPLVFYFGAVDGGVWKTTNGGETWANLTDGRADIASVGAIAVAPSDPNVIYVGAGEADWREDLTYGDGMWRSTDGGETWRHLGLEDTRHIDVGVRRVHPHDGDVARVLEAQVSPRLTAVGRAPHAVAVGEVLAPVGLAGPYVDHVGVGRCHRDGAHRGDVGAAVGEVGPGLAAVRGLPHAAVHRPEVEDERPGRVAGHGHGAPTPEWAYQAPVERAQCEVRGEGGGCLPRRVRAGGRPRRPLSGERS